MSAGFSCPSSLLGERYASPHIGGSADSRHERLQSCIRDIRMMVLRQ